MQPPEEVPWARLLEALPAALASVMQADYEAWAEARQSPPPILMAEELDLIAYYQDLVEKGSMGGAVVILAVAMILGRPSQFLLERWYTLREERRRCKLSLPKDKSEFKREVEARLTKLNELLQHFDSDSLSPRLRVLRAHQERKRGFKRVLSDAWDLSKGEAIDEEIRELTARKTLLFHEVQNLLLPPSASRTSLPALASTSGRRVIVADISHGTWGNPSIPVPCVNDVDNALPPTVQLIGTEIYGEGVPPPLTEVLIGCDCVGDCRSDRNCKCMLDQEQRKPPFDTYQQNHRGRLTTRMWRPDTPRLIKECNMMCKCAPYCRNKVVQKGPKVQVEVFKTKDKGWGVRTLQPILKGTFICTYVGEVITMDEFHRRNRVYQGMAETTYLYDLVFGLERDEQRYMIDATYKGGIARFFNHSCEPNMENFQVFINDLDIHKPHVAFFACRDIKPMEELTFDYKIESSDKSEKCCCGASKCRGLLL